MPETPALPRLIARARQRALVNLVWAQTMAGLAAASGGAVLLLLLGTNILDWYWLVVLFAAGTGLGVWRTLRSLPSPYSVAQQVDERLHLHDALSTALHFGRSPSRGDARMIAMQGVEAETLAATIDPGAAWPITLPRQTYTAAALVAVVLALGMLRYGKQGSLDLRAPLIASVADFFWTGNQIHAQNKKPRLPGEEPLGIALDQPDAENRGNENTPDDLLSTVETPDVNTEGMTSYAEKADRKNVQAKGEGGEQEGSEESEPSGDSRDLPENGSGREPGNEAGSKEGQKGGATPQRMSGENASLLEKMRDAMANLMSKLNIPQQQSQSGKSQSGDSKQQSSRESKGGQKGEKGAGQKQAKGSPSDDADSGEQGQGDQQQAQAGQGKNGDKASDSASNDANSGVGKQDGNKDLRDAEQLAAMGKLSEIYGKRAQNVTGEIMLEVTSGKQQQLRTAYSNRNAAHKEAGGEIHRDEVPLAYQDYVQQYFEKVRSGEAKAAAAAKP